MLHWESNWRQWKELESQTSGSVATQRTLSTKWQYHPRCSEKTKEVSWSTINVNKALSTSLSNHYIRLDICHNISVVGAEVKIFVICQCPIVNGIQQHHGQTVNLFFQFWLIHFFFRFALFVLFWLSHQITVPCFCQTL